MNATQIAHLREKILMLTQEQMARGLGVTTQNVYYWERGKYAPSEYHRVMLARMWELARYPDQVARMRAAFVRAAGLPAAPPPKRREPEVGKALENVALGFGLGVLIAAIFSDAASPKSKRKR